MNSICFLVIAHIVACYAENISEKHSFATPFHQYGWSGDRKIDGWTCGGDATIKEFFVRLTPDRQSKSGYCWNENVLTDNKWVTTIKFRISGQGESLYGDGFTVFFTQRSAHENGKMHGSSDQFVGFAITLSTFKNLNYAVFHRDISLFIGNNTNDSAFRPDLYHPGCYSNYRYHEKRQDFSVDHYAVIRIAYDGDINQVNVLIDSTNSGTFESCISETLSIDSDWWKQAYIGLSASTGQLADNHDILSVTTVLGKSLTTDVPTTGAPTSEYAKQDEQLDELLKSEGILPETLNPKERALFAMVQHVYATQQNQIHKMQRELEHSLAAIDDSINSMIKKLQERGDVSETRIADLEETLRLRVGSALSSQMGQRMANLEKVFDEDIVREVKKKSGTWIIPFLLLSVVLCVIFYMASKQYRYLQKTHMF